MGALLTAQNLSFAYDGRPVLKGVSLAVEAEADGRDFNNVIAARRHACRFNVERDELLDHVQIIAF